KLAAVRLVQQFSPDATALPDAAYREAASLLAFCIQGEARLGEILGPEEAALLSHRLQAATDSEGRLDAALVLLALHAGLVSPDVRAEFSLRIVQE
ncbi:MAG TPA: hypothetical protein VGN98_00885, partial [Tianweitania sediminis]|nr:hypothetical protein [Tianweitania sediminis]